MFNFFLHSLIQRWFSEDKPNNLLNERVKSHQDLLTMLAVILFNDSVEEWLFVGIVAGKIEVR